MPNNSLLEPNGSGENQIQKNLFRRQFRASLRGRPLQRREVSLIECCAITQEGEKLLENAVTRLGLSARAHDRILKVARTIADLEAAPDIQAKHLSEAIQYRTLDRSYWA